MFDLTALTNAAPPPNRYTVIRQLRQHRWVTLVGAAGVGKTALAVAVARFLGERSFYTGGVVLVELGQCRWLSSLFDLR